MVDDDTLSFCERLLDHRFRDPALLDVALTHASVAPSRVHSNERLEFLGDAVLGMVVCAELYRRYPRRLEGELTKIKSAVVSRRTCAAISKGLGLPELLSVGKGMSSRPTLPPSLAAAVFESLIAALYIDSRSFEKTRAFILAHVTDHIIAAAASEHQRNYKSQLQQYSQKETGVTPQYLTLDEQGPDHSKCFEVAVAIAGRRFPSAWGPSKKEAEQKAAMNALAALDLLPDEVLEESA